MRNSIFLLPVIFIFISCSNQSAKQESAEKATNDYQTEEPVSGQAKTSETTNDEAVYDESQLTPEMFADFLKFRKAQLDGSCEDVADLCDFPLQGACAGMTIVGEDFDPEMEIGREQVLENCRFLGLPETAVLKKRTSLKAKTDVKSEGCTYRDSFWASEDGEEFSWSVGCSAVSDDDIGEFTLIFIFHKKGNRFMLYSIDCAG